MLQKYGDVICVDLPGHGASDKILGYTMTELSYFITQNCLNLGLSNICFVGLNNGANIIIEIALTSVLPIHSMILIDPPLFLDKTFISEISKFINHLNQDCYDIFIDKLVCDLFIDTSIQNKEIAKYAFNVVNKKALQDIFRGLIEWNDRPIGRLKNILHPTLCILTDEHHCKFSKLNEEAPQFTIGKVIGSKCWATLEVPEQVNAMIERFIIINR